MKILIAVILCIFPIALYYNYNQSQKEISSFYAEAHSYSINTISDRLKDIVNNVYLISDNFLNKHRHQLTDEAFDQLQEMFLWKFSSISVFNEQEICTHSTNKSNLNQALDNLTTITEYEDNKVTVSSPYIVEINKDKEIFIDLIVNLKTKVLLFRLNSNQIQSTMGPSIYTFIKDLKSGLLVYPFVYSLESQYSVKSEDPKYIKREYGSVVSGYPVTNLPPDIQHMLDTNDFRSDTYICTSLIVGGFNWEIIQITIPHINNYGIMLIYGLCIVAVVILLYLIRVNRKQVDMIYKFMEGEYNKVGINNVNYSLIEQINKLSDRLQDSNVELNNQIKKSDNEKNLLRFAQENEKKNFIESIQQPVKILDKSVKKIEDRVYVLYTKIEENSLRILLLYFIIRHLLGNKIAEMDDEQIMSVDNKKLLDDFKAYLEKENFINIDPTLMTQENLLKLIELFKHDIEYLSQYIQEDYIQLNTRVEEIVGNINDVQTIVRDIKPYIATIFEKIQYLNDVVKKG